MIDMIRNTIIGSHQEETYKHGNFQSGNLQATATRWPQQGRDDPIRIHTVREEVGQTKTSWRCKPSISIVP